VIRTLLLLRVGCVLAAFFAVVRPAQANAQERANPNEVCDSPIPQPAALPPQGTEPVIYQIVPCFQAQGGAPLVEVETYLYYIHLKPSRPSENDWTLFDESAKDLALEDFKRLWATGFLENLSIEAIDYSFPNGAPGKLIVYHMEERQRVKIVEYQGLKSVERSTIDDRLKEAGVSIRLDTFIDDNSVRKAEGIVRQLLQEKGYQAASVTHRIEPLSSQPKLVRLAFELSEGPQTKIQSVRFAGNQGIGARTLRKQLKRNKPRSWWVPRFLPSWFLGGSTYQEPAFDEDADHIAQFYRDNGYVTASVGVPQLAIVRESKDHRTRWAALTIPITEGMRYRVGSFDLDGNSTVKSYRLKPLFKVTPNGYYSEQSIRKGLEKAREAYGAAGYFEFTAYPDLKPREAEGVVDVTLRVQEGKQFFVNRISFSGNTVTHDNVVRREVALVEGGVLNTEVLKYSVRRLNQLGYFKPLQDQKNVVIDKVAGTDDRVDVTLKVEEQNRNSVNLGAGLSQYEGIFGSVAYTTSNLLGRGESLTLTLQKGSRANIYQFGATEPYLLGRPISTSVSLYSRKYDFYQANASTTGGTSVSTTTNSVAYSEVREGSTVAVGRPLWRFATGSLGYTYEIIDVAIAESLLTTTSSGSNAGLPLFNPNLDNGRHIDSRIMLSLVYNTVDNPIMAHSGTRVSGNVQIAGEMLRGGYNYLKPELELVRYFPTSRRTGFGLRAQSGLLWTYGSTTKLPYYLRYYLGGENQIRGTDYQTVGPLDSQNRNLGGNKFLLFNAEYHLDLFSSVRLLAFHDAGQAFDETHPFNILELRTSSGGELRVFVPVLNVPFRLIYYVNKYRDTFQPGRGFKFAIGTTF
jgi:outer membrane protein insertion porin family